MLRSEFLEEEFIASFDVVLSQHPRKESLRIDRISQMVEKKEGYDGIIYLKKVVYVQFKRSDYFSRTCIGPIRTAREAKYSARGEDFYSFKLFKKDGYRQHNLLWGLAQKNDAFYCAPLFHTKAELNTFHNFTKKNININKTLSYSGQSLINNTICIRPHKKITDQDSHRYTYDKSNNIVFHSEPEKITGYNILFTDYFKKLMSIEKENIKFSFILTNLEKLQRDERINVYSELCNYYNRIYKKDHKDDGFIKELTDINIGLILERYLKDKYNIIQYCVFSEKNAGVTGIKIS